MGFIIITTAFKIIKTKINKKDMKCKIKVIINSNYTYLNAIIDTGNFLREPITKMPVIVASKDCLEDLVPGYILDNIDKIINGNDIDLKDYSNKIRIIPFTSLGKENGILLGIKADFVLIEQEEDIIKINNVIVGIYNGVLNRSGRYNALIGLDLLEEKEGGTENEHIRDIKV